VEPSPAEQAMIKAVRRARLFMFLREHRHELFDEEFQAELAQAYADSPTGQPPVPPARLALATILQAYAGVSDDEVIEATVMDRRWQLVLDCMDAREPPFSKGTLVGFRSFGGLLALAQLGEQFLVRVDGDAAPAAAGGAALPQRAGHAGPLREPHGLAWLEGHRHPGRGRAQLRERVAVEHALAHIGHWQGRRARYNGTRENLFDLRRVAVVHNLHVIARQDTTITRLSA
jgi:hypothetical protein